LSLDTLMYTPTHSLHTHTHPRGQAQSSREGIRTTHCLSVRAGRVRLTDSSSLVLGGKANNAPGYYKQDWNNFAPAVSFAWSPDFGNNTFGRIFGRDGKSVVRGDRE